MIIHFLLLYDGDIGVHQLRLGLLSHTMSTTNACPVRQIASRRLDRLVNGREHVLTLKNVAKAVVWYGRSNRFRAALPEHSLQLVMKTTLRIRARVPHQQQLFFLYGVCNVERLIRLVL